MGKVFIDVLVKTEGATGISASDWVDLRSDIRAKLENRYTTYENQVNRMHQLVTHNADETRAKQIKSLVAVMKEFNSRIPEFKMNINSFAEARKKSLLLGLSESEAIRLTKEFTIVFEEDLFEFLEVKDNLLLEFDLLSHPILQSLMDDKLTDEDFYETMPSLSMSDLETSSPTSQSTPGNNQTPNGNRQGLFAKQDDRHPKYVGGSNFGIKK